MLRLTTDRSPDWDPHWSPDGREIAFYSNRSGNRDIRIVPTADGAARQITKHEAEDLLVSWSPDGSELVFSSDRGGTYEAWVISSEGGEPRVLSPGFRTAWSPSGQFIAMDRVDDRGYGASLPRGAIPREWARREGTFPNGRSMNGTFTS